MFPLNRVFDWDEWQESFGDYWIAKGEIAKREFSRSSRTRSWRISNPTKCR